MPHTRIWDETSPANSQAASQGAARIREMKVDITERMAIDHYWDVDVNTDGWHKQVTMPESASDPADVLNQGILYTKDDSAVTHLYYVDSAGTIYKLTGTTSNVTVPWASISGVPDMLVDLAALVDPDANAYVTWDDAAGELVFTTETLGGQVYCGYVNGDASAFRLPTGWSVAALGSGQYEVTHNLGLADGTRLSVQVTPYMTSSEAGRIQSGGATDGNSFIVQMFTTSTGSASTAAFFFSAQAN